ncbi:MAG: radical SAM protein [Planctomycetota bacterium]|jgi:wyosine [tRNA(Phe)-imidazoG37] synthetase (radical SAM superfamily)
MPEGKKYLFGPVPSRRLGFSLGVDIVPFKVCTLDCIYCQIGKTTRKTVERRDYVPIQALLTELKDKLARGLHADFITISGSGEPTLNSNLGLIIEEIKKITDIPVAVLTNGTLFSEKSVRTACAKAELVLPSLDAGDEQTFAKINCPHRDITIDNLVDGLCAFRDEFAGRIWLEVFLVEGINTNQEQITNIKHAIERIRPDKIQLNSAVRPTAETGLQRIAPEKLRAIAEKLGQNCEIIADFSTGLSSKHGPNKAESLLSILKRRPCSLDDISAALGITPKQALEFIEHLWQKGLVNTVEKNGVLFYKAD